MDEPVGEWPGELRSRISPGAVENWRETCYGISAILPRAWPVIMARCAAATSVSGNVWLTITRSCLSLAAW